MGIEKFRRHVSGAEFRTTGITYTQATAGVGANSFLMAAPCNCVVEEVILISDTATTASVAAQHYEFQVANMTQSENLLSAVKSTVTANVLADTAFVITPDQNNIVTQDDVIEFQVTVAGTPTDLSGARMTVQCNYRPV